MKSLFLLYTLFIFNIVISIYFFTNGFLIRRLSLNYTNDRSYPELKRFDKAIIMFVDALRFDFIFSNKTEYFGLPTIEKLILNEKANAKLYKFISDPPTTTMQRIKGLMSGTLPTFIDAGSNFNSYIIEDDNLIKQAYLNNKSVIILGDDTWLSLFESNMIKLHHTYPSFNIKDLDSNDINVNRELGKILNSKNDLEWSLLIAHYLGIDHCGHSFGPKSPVIKRKLKDIDETISFVTNSIDNDTLLILIGDHGMTETGDHGGDSKMELETVLFFYSKKELFISSDNIQNRIRDMLFEEVKQIDLTPTVALALGLPIPYSNLGIVLDEIFPNDENFMSIKANFFQMNQFVKNYETLTNEKFLDQNEDLNFDHSLKQKGHNKNLQIELKNYLKLIQNKCREKWSTFNIQYCIIGLIIIFLSIVSLIILNNNFDNIYANIHNFSTVLFQTSLIIFLTNLIIFVFILKFKFVDSIWIYITLFNFYFISKFKFSIAIVFDFFLKSFKFDYFILMLVYLIPFSNSYIISENNSLRFLLVSFIFYEFFVKLKSFNSYSIIINFIIMLFILRLSSIFYVCREEAFNCQPTIFSTQLNKFDINSDHLLFKYFLFILLNFCIIGLVNAYLIIKFRLNSKLINLLLITKFLLLFIYKYMQLIELNDANTKYINLCVARSMYMLFIICLLSIISYESRINQLSKILYTVINFGYLITLISAESFISIWLLIALLCLYFDNLIKSSNYEQIEPTTCIFLLQYYYFYATGHETTFTHIRWDSAFHGIYGDNNNQLIRVMMGFLILCNTFGSIIVTGMSTRLFIDSYNYSSKNQFKNLNKIRTTFIKLLCRLNIFISIKALSSAVAVFFLRRHLMVWKIFAPRFVFECIGVLLGMVISWILMIGS